MATVAVFVNADTADVQVYESLESFREQSDSNLDLTQQNDQGDILVVRPNGSPWGKTIGYIQIRSVL